MAPERPTPAAGTIQIAVSNLQSTFPVDPARVEAIVRRVLHHEAITAAEISVVVVDDAAIRVINARHLAHDWPTDVVSFAFGTPGWLDFGGEVIISAETAAREAGLRHVPPEDEFALYLVHGLLHLLGDDDRSEVDERAMRLHEEEILQRLGIENPFGRGRVGPGFIE